MKRFHLSPVTSVLVSLSLVVGILVCDLTGATPSAHAQTGAPHVYSVTVSAARLTGSVIAAKGVMINGVATDAVFVGGIKLSNSVIQSGDGVYVTGAFPSGGGDDTAEGAFPSGIVGDEPTEGAFPSGDEPTDGAFPSGIVGEDLTEGAFPSGIISSDGDVTVIGGTLQGTNIQVTNGVISGENLVLVGAYVTSSGAQ